MTRRKDPRSARLPVAAVKANGGELPPFTPVPRQYNRHDGWTPQRQRDFIEALADTGSVEAAARAVDMSTEGAYHLRRSPGADEFRAAWEAALQLGVQRIEDVAMDRALNGTEEPVYSYGKLIGTRIKHNDGLLMFILRNRAPERFAAGGGPRGMNAVDAATVERLKQEWRKEWEAEKPHVSAAEVRASIDRKVEEIRLRLRYESEGRWAALTEETRAAWAHFIALRDRDLAALNADAKTREVLNVRWDASADRFDPPAVRRIAGPTGSEKTVPPVKQWQPPEPTAAPEPKTVRTMKDEE